MNPMLPLFPAAFAPIFIPGGSPPGIYQTVPASLICDFFDQVMGIAGKTCETQ
jgi:hypothetical protein